MYNQIVLYAFALAALGASVAMLSQMVGEFRAVSRSAHERRCRKELDLKCKVRPACQNLLKAA